MGFAPYVPLTNVGILDVIRPEQSSAPMAPRVALHRTAAAAVDTVIPAVSSAGINMAGYDVAIIHVVPIAGTPEPDIEVLQWSESAGTFVSFATAKTASAPAANTPYIYQTDVDGGIIWVKVGGTVGVADALEILVSASVLDRNG